MTWVIVWVIASILIGVLASQRERFGFGWFLLSLVISPLLAGLGLLIAGTGGEQVRCPACRELVRADAVKCKHCGEVLPGITRPVERDRGGMQLLALTGLMVAAVFTVKACS